MKDKFVVCFGEVLWDNLPSGKVPGGAPLNVAYHLNKLGVTVSVISSVGKDQNGVELLNAINAMGLSTANFLIHQNLPTSTVEVEKAGSGDMSYTIPYPVAWDDLKWQDSFHELASQSDALVFGSLSGRKKENRKVLEGLLDCARMKVFDVNLRQPFYSREYILFLLQKTDLLKLNSQELEIILSWLGKEEKAVSTIFENFPIKEILLTNGAEGATYYTREIACYCPAIDVEVMDTVGSGDSFLAAFLANRLQGREVQTAMLSAAKLSAFITSKKGSCPEYVLDQVEALTPEVLPVRRVFKGGAISENPNIGR